VQSTATSLARVLICISMLQQRADERTSIGFLPHMGGAWIIIGLSCFSSSNAFYLSETQLIYYNNKIHTNYYTTTVQFSLKKVSLYLSLTKTTLDSGSSVWYQRWAQSPLLLACICYPLLLPKTSLSISSCHWILKPLEVVRSSTESIRYEVNRLVLAGWWPVNKWLWLVDLCPLSMRL